MIVHLAALRRKPGITGAGIAAIGAAIATVPGLIPVLARHAAARTSPQFTLAPDIPPVSGRPGPPVRNRLKGTP
jgi:hypothetical protein